MASAATKERLRKLRQKYGLGEYKRSRSSGVKRRKRGVVHMAKRRSSGRRSGFGGLFGSSMVKHAAFGAGVALLTKQPIVNGAVFGVVGGKVMGDLGALGAPFVAPMLLGSGSSSPLSNIVWYG